MPNAPRTTPLVAATAALCVLIVYAWGGNGFDRLTASSAMAAATRTAGAAHPLPGRTAAEWAAPSGFVASAPGESFGPDTLFEIINGDADLYLKAGFERLDTRHFNLKSPPRDELSVFIYQMKQHRSAFAVYSVRRDEEARPSPLTRFAHRDQNGLFLVHGPYYIEILAAAKSFVAASMRGDSAAARISI